MRRASFPADRKPIESLEAYDYALRGQSIIADTKENNLRARQAHEKAIELDPTCTRAFVELALSYVIDGFNHWWDPSDLRAELQEIALPMAEALPVITQCVAPMRSSREPLADG